MKTIIGIIGPLASGKDTAAEYTAKRLGFPIFNISDVLKDIAKQKGIDPKRENLILLSRGLQLLGDDYLAKTLFSKMRSSGIILGMRQLAQISFLRNKSRLILISIDASPKIRFERMRKRAKYGDPESFEDFTELEKMESSKENAQKLLECMKLADYSFINDKKHEDLYNFLDDILEKERLL